VTELEKLLRVTWENGATEMKIKLVAKFMKEDKNVEAQSILETETPAYHDVEPKAH